MGSLNTIFFSFFRTRIEIILSLWRIYNHCSFSVVVVAAKTCCHFSAEPILADAESHAILVLVVVLVSVMVIAGIMASIAWKKWKKEKQRAIELERAKEAITQQWIKKVSQSVRQCHRLS